MHYFEIRGCGLSAVNLSMLSHDRIRSSASVGNLFLLEKLFTNYCESFLFRLNENLKKLSFSGNNSSTGSPLETITGNCITSMSVVATIDVHSRYIALHLIWWHHTPVSVHYSIHQREISIALLISADGGVLLPM